MTQLNPTHDPNLQSWVSSANAEGTDFPIQNLPFASFRRAGSDEAFRVGVAIGDRVIDLNAAAETSVFKNEAATAISACVNNGMNGLMALDHTYWSALRAQLSQALREGASADIMQQLSACMISQQAVEYTLPCKIGDYTDFYTSIYHATTVGSLFRPDNPLLPNYKWVPIGYHGRASSIVVSGVDFPRPSGQIKPPTAEQPSFGPAQRLDYELELGIFIGTGNKLGEPISITEAEQHVFGICLLNDWSARDIQAWEYQPLGPFLAKNFLSSVSPWIVTLEALAPFRCGWQRPQDDPQPLAYLDSEQVRREGALDINLAVYIETEQARKEKRPAEKLSQSNFLHSYWTVSQLVTHHSVNGCNLNPGDLLGSGTQSGPEPEEAGSMLELSLGGKQAVTLATGETRSFLADGDRITLKGWCDRKGYKRIGFGEVTGTLLPAKH